MLQVTEPAAKRNGAPALGYSGPVQKAWRSATSIVLLVPSVSLAKEALPLAGWPFTSSAVQT